ncbi:MAG TPA: alpha/beta hydrolase [Candidatus Pacearchaeota archaeon]|nr:alpha/beta hydrolase [Candidatus Pacearchaeota archaeon]
MKEEIFFINNLNINVKIFGEGKIFLVLHGWGSKSDRWEKFGNILSNYGFKVIIPDLPGFGKSEKMKQAWSLDDYCFFVEDFANFLNIERFYLLGHSFGGSIAIKYSLKFSQRVEKLFLFAPSCIREKNLKKNFLKNISKIFNKFSFLPFYNFFKKIFYKFIVRKSDYLLSEGVLKETYLKIINEDLSNSLSLINIPTIIIWGDKDDIVPLENGKIINQKIKNSKLVIIKNGDHNLEQTIPDILSQKILENL